MQTLLSPDGKTLACYRFTRDLDLIDVASGEHIMEKKEFLAGKTESQEGIDSFLISYTLPYLNLGFSPDGKYFVAALRNEHALAYDVAEHRDISVPSALRSFIGSSFAFITPDSIVGYSGSHGEKSAIVEFPSGKIIRPLDLGGARPSPATHGDYILIRPIKDNPVGILDVSSNQIVGANKLSAIDIYDKHYVSEMKNGHIGLFGAAPAPLAELALPRGAFGPLRTAVVSEDLSWLAVSGRLRGAVWSLPTSSRVLNLREFAGAYISPDGVLFADFPKHEGTARSIAHIAITQRQFSEAMKPPYRRSRQVGAYLVTLRPANDSNNSGKKTDDNEEDLAESLLEGLNWHFTFSSVYPEIEHNTIFEVRRVDSGTLLWSHNFPKETPRQFIRPHDDIAVFVWYVGESAAKAELRDHPEWRSRLSAVKDSDNLVEVYDLPSGKLQGGLIVSTGEGSFELTEARAAGSWLIVTDNLGRALVYSLASGKQLGKQFGSVVEFSAPARLLCLQRVPGELEIYSVDSMEKTDDFAFASNISMATFLEGGKKLFVLTADQSGYLLQLTEGPETKVPGGKGP
jgi:hypothetical protein